MPAIKCAECGNKIERRKKPQGQRSFCRLECKARWQRRAKPVSKEWLSRKYITEGRDCVEIATLVDRDPKSVWNWLKDLGIPTRPRGSSTKQHFKKGHKLCVGRSQSEATREKIRQARFADGRIPCYVNGVHWTKAYPDRHPASWRGGISPQRQAFYGTPEWKEAVKAVWKRDKATCQGCLRKKKDVREVPFDIHHIESFQNEKLRARVSNLILLCEPCHYWIHGKKNTTNLFIKR